MSRWRRLEPRGRDTPDPVVLAQAGHVAGLHALELEAEDVEHVGPLDRVLDAGEDLDAQLLGARRQAACGGPHTATSAPSFSSP